MSALADGQSDALSPGAALWREHAAARAAWHEYHLIGDMLRSEDLASTGARDEAFLQRLRQRLAEEPVPLAPEPLTSAAPPLSPPRRLGWQAPAAAAAGFAVVAVSVMMLRQPAPSAPVELADSAPATVMPSSRPSFRVVVPPASLEAQVSEGRVIRDARLDDYLRAHFAARGNAAPATPRGALRSVEMLLPPEAVGSAATRSAAGGSAAVSKP